MSLLLALALLATQDAPLPITTTDKRYPAAAETVRGWIAKRDKDAKGDPTLLLICDWRPGHRTALVKGVREGITGKYPTQSIYYEDSLGTPMRLSYSNDGKTLVGSDQPLVDAALKACAPQLAQ